MNDKERIEQTFSRSINMRGVILDEMIDVERLIDSFLSVYFTSDELKENELKEMLWYSERITLGSKKDILFLILDAHYAQWIKENPNFKTTLEATIPHRNIFAHLEIDLNREYEDVDNHIELIFKKYKSGKLKPVVYKDNDLEDMRDNFRYLKLCLMGFITTTKPPSA